MYYVITNGLVFELTSFRTDYLANVLRDDKRTNFRTDYLADVLRDYKQTSFRTDYLAHILAYMSLYSF